MATYQEPIGEHTLRVIRDREHATAFAVENYGARIQQYMQSGGRAPWNNRTWDARRGLRAEVIRRPITNGINLRLVVQHTAVHRGYLYGKRLEYDFGGKYAILHPTVEFWMPRINQRMRAIWGAGVPRNIESEVIPD